MSIASRPTDLDAVRAALEADYEVFEELGRGGMAIVYRARERALDREVAIKILPPQFAFDEGFVERFQREARIAAQLEHPHVVPIHRVGRAGHTVYLAMKLLRGESLSSRLRGRTRLETAEVRRVLLETASALGYAAKRGVVHRDIKPDNIMLDEDGRCIVTDFGIARSVAESKLTATGMSVGTPRYMSPEQARAGELDGRSDIYSLGIVGYECLVGATPFEGGDAFAILMAHINDPVPRPALRTADERALFQIIDRMLAKDPRDRFQSAGDVVAALQSSVVGDATVPNHRVPVTTPTAVSPAVTAARTVRLDSASGAGGLRWPPAALTTVLGRVESGRTWITGRSRRFWGTGIAACVTGVVLSYGIHFSTKHRSRCPAPAAAAARSTAATGATDTSAPARARPFSVALDAVSPREPGQSVQLYYDVCGLEPGTPYTASVRIARNESSLKRLLGRSVQPVTLAFNERADGPTVRHHETVDFSDMPPGSYSLTLSVTDAAGRRRDKASEFQVLDPER